MITDKPLSVDEYVASFPEDIQNILEQLRSTIKKAAPQAEEVISYSMPLALITRIVEFRVKENVQRAKEKNKKA